MKKTVMLIILFALSVIMLTGCGSITGKWHCVKLSIDGEKISNSECEKIYGYGLSYFSEIEFNKDDEGKLIIRDDPEMTLTFKYSKDEDEYDLDIDESQMKGLATTKDGKLILTLKRSIKNYVITFEKGENDEEPDPDAVKHSQVGLESVNSNAKIVYISLNEAVNELVSDGHVSLISAGKFGPIKVSELIRGDVLQKELASYLSIEDADFLNGYISYEVSTYKKITWAQWSADKKGIVGQYPNPETDPYNEHNIGEEFH